jgi:general secretion pathway protein G
MRGNGAILVLGGLAAALLAVAAGIWIVLDRRYETSPQDLPVPDAASSNGIKPTDPADDDPVATEVRIRSMQQALQPDGILDTCIRRYHVRLGRYPRSLDDLLTEPQDLRPGERWDGPYIHNARFLNDPWNRRYEYVSPGVHNPDSYDIWSRGQDSISGTEDDVGNW